MKGIGLPLLGMWFTLAWGCASDQHQWLARVDDYELYRQARVAGTLEERLTFAWRYLRHYPNGAFRAELQRWFKQVEPDYFDYAWPSRRREAARGPRPSFGRRLAIVG